MYAIRSYYVSWSDLGTRVPASSTLTAMTAFDLSAYNGTQVRIRFTVAGTLSGIGAGIDEISVTGYLPTSPTITVNPATISGLNYVEGNGRITSYNVCYTKLLRIVTFYQICFFYGF